MGIRAKTCRSRRCAGLSLVEVLVGVSVLVVVFMGHSWYRYYATFDAHRADMQHRASRVGVLLCESWRATGGMAAFDAVNDLDSCLTVSVCSSTEQQNWTVPGGFTLSGVYRITVDDDAYFAALSWQQINSTLRALNVDMAWATRQPRQPALDDVDKSYKLTTYASSVNGWQ